MPTKDACPKGLRAIHLPLAALQGSRGAQGASGAPGAAGAQGIQGSAGAQGPQGSQGAQGGTGGQGAQGVAGISGYQLVTNSNSLIAGSQGPTKATCPAGKTVIGGGVTTDGGAGAYVADSYPLSPTVWSAVIDNTTGVSIDVFVTAICVVVSG